MNTNNEAIIFNNVGKQFSLDSGTKTALHDIHFTIKPGERVGLIGNNGSGKTTLLQLIAGITTPTSGEITIKGSVASVIDLAAGFHSDLTGYENIPLNGLIMGMSEKQVRLAIPNIVQFCELDETVLHQPVRTYSQGMLLRLAFSIALNSDPDILLIDEQFVVGDLPFQKKSLSAINRLFVKGVTIIFASHLPTMLRRFCNRYIWLDRGHVIADDGIEVLQAYIKGSRKWLGSSKTEYDRELFNLLAQLPSGSQFSVRAASGSMEPSIYKGQTVVIRRSTIEDSKIGDVVAFFDSGLNMIVVHRLIKKTKRFFYTQGDANPHEDPLKTIHTACLGKVVDVI